MEKKQLITGIVLIPATNNATNALKVLEKVSNALGWLHCTTCDVAMLRYEGLISDEQKNKINKIVEQYNYVLMYIEAYEEDERLTNDTICLTNEEI